MAMAHKSVISFGLVAIPISMYTATQDNDIHFNQLHKEDNSRIRYKKTCAHCGQEITTNDIVKGYEYNKDNYVVVTDEELERIKTEKEKSIQILHFAQLNQISLVFYEKTYQAIPEPGGEKAFELLRKALMDEQKIAIGKTVLGTKDIPDCNLRQFKKKML
jgi:DNA end-binding protein Ku